MAEIKPFRGIRYAWEELEAREMQDLVAPPYDVISDVEQEELYRRHPANVVRLDLNRIQRSDDGEDNRYERARRHLFDWIAQGVVVVDREPTLYVHEQRFRDESGQLRTRRGFIGLVRLADYEERIVLPHERTLRGPKKDRLELMKATECNLSQIFFLYDDPDFTVDETLFSEVGTKRDSDVDITTEDGIRHRLWSVRNEGIHRIVGDALRPRPLLIADGHHRYETALAYRDFRRRIDEDPLEKPPYEYVMGFFVNIHDPGLEVFPTHRVVHSLDGFDFDAFCEDLDVSDDFEVFEIDDSLLEDLDELRRKLSERGRDQTTFAMVSPGGRRGFWVSFAGDEDAPFFEPGTPESVRRLDVTILHDGIFEDLLGIDRDAQRDMSHLGYVKRWSGARKALDDGDTQMVVFMNPTPVSQVNEVCLSGSKMPQKSTYFHPKILSGLVFNPL